MANYGPTALAKAFIEYFQEKATDPVTITAVVNETAPAIAKNVVEEAQKEVCSTLICTLSEAKDNLVPYIEKVGVAKDYSGYIATGLVVFGALGVAYKRFNASTPYDLIKNIIAKEFGKGSIADEIFKAFEKSIEDAIDAQLKEFADKYKMTSKQLSVKDKADFTQQNQQTKIDALKAQLERGALKANRESLIAAAKAVTEASDKVVTAPAAPGTQEAVHGPRLSAKAQAQMDLQKMVKIVFFIAKQISEEATKPTALIECSDEQKAAYAEMIRKHFDGKKVTIISCEKKEWNNGGMGLNDGGINMMMITSGARVVADVDGVQHTLHVSDHGAVRDAGILATLESKALAALK